MASEYEIPKKLKRYLKRLVSEYRRGEDAALAAVLEGSKYTVNEHTSYDNWNGGMFGHDVVFLVPDDLMGNIPLDDQHEIQRQVREDLNKASSSIDDEYINEVHFEYLDEQDSVNAQSLNASKPDDHAVSSIWQPDTVRLFISHRDTWKQKAHDLAEALIPYGVSSFVAHDTIEPDEDWQAEIEKALKTMDAMLAFITDDFFDSVWTNQEIGFALAQSNPVIRVKFHKTDPLGFIRNIQALPGDLNDPKSTALGVFTTIEKRLGKTQSFRKAMLQRLSLAKSFAHAESLFDTVEKLEGLTQEDVSSLADAFNNNSQLSGCWALTRDNRFLNFLN